MWTSRPLNCIVSSFFSIRRDHRWKPRIHDSTPYHPTRHPRPPAHQVLWLPEFLGPGFPTYAVHDKEALTSVSLLAIWPSGRAFRDILTGDWADLARSVMFHTQTEAHKDLRPFDLVLQASLKPYCIYYHTSKVGFIVNKDTESNQRRYIVLDFDAKRLRVVEGERWDVKRNYGWCQTP
ncbi:hypothetical protein QBC45DRAFT_102018 [Copromyces sp. CBS 386.78]|nr:hypothetical protein QBC45DRAFT_102018 [Copromyces sp. CBS 386.78]